MKSNEFYEFFNPYVTKVYGPGCRWDIEITTKRKPKTPMYGPGATHNKYTMFIIDKDGNTIMKSKEFEGYNKSLWSGQAYVNFVTSLEEVGP